MVIKDPKTKGLVRRIVEEAEKVDSDRRLVQDLGLEYLEKAPYLVVMFEQAITEPSLPFEQPITNLALSLFSSSGVQYQSRWLKEGSSLQ